MFSFKDNLWFWHMLSQKCNYNEKYMITLVFIGKYK